VEGVCRGRQLLPRASRPLHGAAQATPDPVAVDSCSRRLR